jgi:hypothetical protein
VLEASVESDAKPLFHCIVFSSFAGVRGYGVCMTVHQAPDLDVAYSRHSWGSVSYSVAYIATCSIEIFNTCPMHLCLICEAVSG